MEDFLELKNITKRFPGVLALNEVNFSVRKGEIHALVGENGAGKSTLMNVLGGTVRPDSGSIQMNGTKLSIFNPRDSLQNGIGFVHQESNLLENLTITENVYLAREKRDRSGSLDRTSMRADVAEICGKLGYRLDPDARVCNLTLAEKQCAEIARALLSEPRVLILDEPTAALDEGEVQRLFQNIRKLKQNGVAIIYISHRLDEVIELADRATVLKDGAVVGTLSGAEIEKNRMIAMMVGRVLEDIYPDRSSAAFGEDLLTVTELSVPGKVSKISFQVKAGEIVGLGGLEGQGQRAAVRAIFGDIPFSEGSVVINGVTLKSKGISARIQNHLAYVTDDRRGEGLVMTLSLRKNCALAALRRLSSRLGWIHGRQEAEEVRTMVDEMQIKMSSINQMVSNLSGGNQQKVMLARWLMTKPRVLIIDEPTKGVDVGARMSVYQIINELTKAGIGIVMLTSDMMELIGLSDRILVFYEGKIVREIAGREATELEIMRAASGTASEQEAAQ